MMYLICSVLMFSATGYQKIVIAGTDTLFWLNMLLSAMVTTTLATSFYFYATSELGAEKASSFIFLVPISASLSSLILLNETITPSTVSGDILGAAAVFIINRKTRN